MADAAGPKIGDARSLWNFTPSPGWTKDEAYALRQCLKKFGIGRWVQIVDSGVLPGKQIQQLNGQTQRLLGKQSLAEYSGLRLDVDRIRMDNDALVEGVTRKNGLITNQGGILSKEALKALREENLKKYGLTDEEVEAIELPAPPRAVPVGAERYMGKSAGVNGAETAAPIKMDVLTTPVEGLSREQKLAMLKALRSRVEDLRAQLGELSATPKKAKASTPLKKAPTPAKKAPTPAKKAPTPAKKAPTPAKKATPAKRAASKTSAASTKRGKKNAKFDDSDDDGTYETIAVVDTGGPVEMLMNMGFSKKHCLDALETCGGDVTECVEWLMTNCA